MSLPRLRAPREDGGVLAVPPLGQAGMLLTRNRHDLASVSLTLCGMPFERLRRLARTEAWTATAHYLAEGDEPLPPAPHDGQPWLLAGHQPEMFHPGVWVKNFALKGLAQAHRAFSLNLVVDNDAAKPPRLHVPAGSHVASIPFDHAQGESPYEERPVLDEALFASLPDRVNKLAASWPFAPLLPVFWQEVRRRGQSTSLLGERIAAGRRALERRWGCVQAEVPLSRLCAGEAFARFACHLLDNARRLLEVYNHAVHDYRQRYGLRSAYHPVPDLAAEGDWCELPLWAWRSGQRRRARLFVRQTQTEMQLRAGGETWPALTRSGDPERFVGQWQELAARGYKVRTRALTTTLFARLFLGDLFIHGIGGGKYDELTDALIVRFFECPVPGFLVLTATRLLPLPRYPVGPETCRRLAREYRDLWYNPQRHFPATIPATAQDLVRARDAAVRGAVATRDQRVDRFHRLRTLNERLRPFLDGEQQRLRRERDECRDRLRINDVQSRRDYPFCLYPEDNLREFYQGFLSGNEESSPGRGENRAV